jgi:3'-phosphoadenosine 5'-phosphosulfate (PAPS) 3'-phosphatase
VLFHSGQNLRFSSLNESPLLHTVKDTVFAQTYSTNSVHRKHILFAQITNALKFGILATGEAELHSRTGPYMECDCAAGDGILRAIGLTVYSRTTGTPLHYNSPDLRVHGLWVSRV